MKRMKLMIGIALAASLTIGALFFWNSQKVGHVLDKHYGDILDVRDFPSPDGRFICTVFGETFHDTTGYARHIYLRRAGEERGYPGNVCVVPVGDDVRISWTSPTNLSVRLNFETRRKVPSETNVAGVAVSFSEMVR